MKNIFLLVLMMGVSASLFGQSFTNYNTASGLLSDNVHDLAVHSNGDIWCATQSGVSVYDGTMWISHTTATDTGLADNKIEAIAIDNSGNVWVGTDFGASFYNGTNWVTYTTADGLDDNVVQVIKVAANNDVWFGSIKGCTKYDGTTFTSFGTSNGLPFGGVSSIAFDSNADVYLGLWLGGLAIYDGATFTIKNNTNGLINDQVRGLTIDPSGDRWLATASGISVFNSSNVHQLNHTRMLTLPAPDTLNPVEDVIVDNNGNIWAAIYVDYLVTEGGVAFYDGVAWQDWDVSDGLAGPNVRKLAVDASNNIWVATSTGVSKMSNVPTSINTSYAASIISVFPNPSTGDFYIDFGTKQINTIKVYSISGRLVHEESINPQSGYKKLSLDKLQNGIYILDVGGEMKKIILSK